MEEEGCMEYMRTLLRDNELFRTFVTVSSPPRSPPWTDPRSLAEGFRLIPFPVFVRLDTVGRGERAVQPPEAGRHGGEASPETDQISTPAEERPEEDGRSVGPRCPQQHGEDGERSRNIQH